LVGGVNSPVRSFKGVSKDYPLFISRARGSKVYDEDNNEYIDYVCSWGASILGSANPKVVDAAKKSAERGLGFGAATRLEVELAEIIRKHFPSMELMRLVSSGTEATMSAIRVARAFTKRDKILKFEGCYHGHADGFLVRGGSGLATFSIADSAGIPESIAHSTLVARYNDLESVREVIERAKNELACIIVEPVAGNMGVVPPEEGFLKGLRRIADDCDALLIFDEVITGFRVSLGGAQALYNVKPDITCLGKTIGGGMNVAAYGGREEIMKLVSPLGPVYQAGTLSGNPVAVSAGIATLKQLSNSTYSKLEKTSKKLQEGLERAAKESNVRIVVQRVGSMLGLFFNDKFKAIKNYDEVLTCDRGSYSSFFGEMLDRGIYLPPSPFETLFVSAAHSEEDIQTTVQASYKSFRYVAKMKELSSTNKLLQNN
jgi:glutamate-1-semialdehyde 2,1-aminomutase